MNKVLHAFECDCKECLKKWEDIEIQYGREVTLKENVIYTGLDENWYPEFIQSICDMVDKRISYYYNKDEF